MKGNFTQVTNLIINDKTLSLEAKGLYLYLKSKPKGWNFYKKDMAINNNTSDYKIRKALKELEEHHYIHRESQQSSDGKFIGWSYEIFDKPTKKEKKKKPKGDKADIGKNRQSVNQPYNNKDISNKEFNNNNCIYYDNFENFENYDEDLKARIYNELEKLYINEYPRKEGKEQGLKIALKIILSGESSLEDIKTAVINYKYQKEKETTPLPFISTFKNFFDKGKYKDFIDNEQLDQEYYDMYPDKR